MKYVLKGTLHTDGDFYVDVNNFYKEEFREHIKWDGLLEEYEISLETTDIFYVRDFLEALVVSYKVGSGHYWLIPDLYQMTIDIKESIFFEGHNFEYRTMGGNYEGTELSLRKYEDGKSGEPEYEDPCETCPRMVDKDKKKCICDTFREHVRLCEGW